MHPLQIALGLCLPSYWSYATLTLVCARAWKRDPTHKQSTPPDRLCPVTILKPLRGTDPDQIENFRSFCRIEYPRFQIVFGALDSEDPALEVARQLQNEFPEVDIAISVGGEAFGYNRKVCNLHQMMQLAKYDLLAVCDSDMRVDPEYLRRVTDPFTEPEVGLVTCPYRGHLAHGLASKLEALGIGADFIPSTFVAYYLWRVRFAFGSTIVVRRSVLEEMGGFAPLANELADDYLLADGARKNGHKVVLSDYVVDDVLGEESFAEMWGRRLRWAKTSRAMQPGPYVGAFITHGFVLSILFLIASGFTSYGWGGVGATLAVRAGVSSFISRAYTEDENLPRYLTLLPLSDLVSFALYVGSFFGRHIIWRGERFRLRRGGRLELEEK
jgi:ceramide glucosyltransferase